MKLFLIFSLSLISSPYTASVVRLIGAIYVNKELLKLEMAWHYKHYNKDPELAKLEKEARAAKIGLWS
jgi:endonuclease YncB( thermonuclease family)